MVFQPHSLWLHADYERWVHQQQSSGKGFGGWQVVRSDFFKQRLLAPPHPARFSRGRLMVIADQVQDTMN
mgnify:CR=1 FL=1